MKGSFGIKLEETAILGGMTLNLIGTVCRLGAKSSIISIVGCDGPGNDALDFLKSVGVDASYVNRADHPIGVVDVSLVPVSRTMTSKKGKTKLMLFISGKKEALFLI